MPVCSHLDSCDGNVTIKFSCYCNSSLRYIAYRIWYTNLWKKASYVDEFDYTLGKVASAYRIFYLIAHYDTIIGKLFISFSHNLSTGSLTKA